MPKLYLELIEDKGEDAKKTGIIALWQRCISINNNQIFFSDG